MSKNFLSRVATIELYNLKNIVPFSYKNGNKFTSEIYYNKNRKIIGHFKTKKEAQKAHDEAKAKYHIIKDRKPCV